MRSLLCFLLLTTVVAAQQLVDARVHRQALEHCNAGRDYYAHENWTRAEAEFQRAIRLDPPVAVAHYYTPSSPSPTNRRRSRRTSTPTSG